MYFFNYSRQLESMKLLLSTKGIKYDGLEIDDIKVLFFKTSLRMQSFPIDKLTINENSIYINDFQLFRYLVEYEGIPIFWKDIDNLNKSINMTYTNFQNGIRIIQNYSEDVLKSCKTANFINCLFVNSISKFKSGSSSTSIGLSFFCVDNLAAPELIASSYLHEAVHNALFIEDLIRSVFGKQEFLQNENAQVISPIRKKMRNYDFTFHATCVSVELMKFYKSINQIDKFESLYKNTTTCIDNLYSVAKCQQNIGKAPLTENGFKVLESLNTEVEKLKSI